MLLKCLIPVRVFLVLCYSDKIYTSSKVQPYYLQHINSWIQDHCLNLSLSNVSNCQNARWSRVCNYAQLENIMAESLSGRKLQEDTEDWFGSAWQAWRSSSVSGAHGQDTNVTVVMYSHLDKCCLMHTSYGLNMYKEQKLLFKSYLG